ncbi:MAG: DUF362 domain-containing protein [Candidatus Woesearchaeota archaeon]
MANIYFKEINSINDEELISKYSKELIETLIKKEKIKLEKEIPLKVHFGEKGNKTFIKPTCFNGIIELLNEKKIKSSYIETNVLYRGERTRKKDHIKLAKKHGFNNLSIIIADGEHGEDYVDIKIDKKHFKTCKIGKEFERYSQFIVISHFKGHILAGFGGAIKQLAMGFASRGGKLNQHSSSIPFINPLKCNKCKICVKNCKYDAIKINRIFPRIVKNKCVGCASCIAVCPYGAVKINWTSSISQNFYEKIAEYAFAAQKNKNNIYINYALNITKQCDCVGREMKPFVKDLGIFVSTDPVAIDNACIEMLKNRENKKLFKGLHTIKYSQEINLGNKEYKLIKL